jgi:hypothetical protein
MLGGGELAGPAVGPRPVRAPRVLGARVAAGVLRLCGTVRVVCLDGAAALLSLCGAAALLGLDGAVAVLRLEGAAALLGLPGAGQLPSAGQRTLQ